MFENTKDNNWTLDEFFHAIMLHLYKEKIIGVTNIILAPCSLQRCINIARRQNYSMKGQYHGSISWTGLACNTLLSSMDGCSSRQRRQKGIRPDACMKCHNHTLFLSHVLLCGDMILNSYSSFYLIMHRLYSDHRKLLFVVQLTSPYILTYQRQSSTWPGFQIFFHARMCHF